MYKLNLEKKSEEAEIKLPISSGSYKTQGNFRKTPTSSLTMLNIWLCHCHYLVAKSCWTLLWPRGLQHAKLHCLWDFSGKNTGVGRHFLFQGVYLMEPMSSALAGSFLTTEPRRKPCFIDYVKPLTEWITTNWNILTEIEIRDHHTCLLGNLYAGQEAIMRTRHRTTHWFSCQIGGKR